MDASAVTLQWAKEINRYDIDGSVRDYNYVTEEDVMGHGWYIFGDNANWLLLEADGPTIIGSWPHATVKAAKAHAQMNANALIAEQTEKEGR